MTPSSAITVYRGFEGSGGYTWSPFVTKLETRLRFGGLSYQVDAGSPMKAPRHKIPYVQISSGQSTETIGDSELIVQKLVEDGLLQDLDATLSPVEKACSHAVRAMLEDKLYFYQAYEKWIQNYYTMRSGVFAALPYPAQIIFGFLVHRGNKQTLYGQGTLRYTSDEIASFRQQVWAHVDALVTESKTQRTKMLSDDDGPFWLFGGYDPSEADAVLYGFIASVLVCPAGPDSIAVVRSFPTIMDYANRIHVRYFPDYEHWNRAADAPE